MRRDTIFRLAVHLIGADLNLKGLPRRADQGRMQRPVIVRLRHRDVILEPPGHGRIHLVNDAERGVAVLDRIDDDPDRKEIVDLVERLPLIHHLLVDAEEVLHASVHLCLDAGLLHLP